MLNRRLKAMKQFLIHLSWYEFDKLAIIKAKNKIKALEKLITEQIKYDKTEDNYVNELPLFCYENDLTERQNVAKYLNSIRNLELQADCFEINSDTDAIVQWKPVKGNQLEQIKE